MVEFEPDLIMIRHLTKRNILKRKSTAIYHCNHPHLDLLLRWTFIEMHEVSKIAWISWFSRADRQTVRERQTLLELAKNGRQQNATHKCTQDEKYFNKLNNVTS